MKGINSVLRVARADLTAIGVKVKGRESPSASLDFKMWELWRDPEGTIEVPLNSKSNIGNMSFSFKEVKQL